MIVIDRIMALLIRIAAIAAVFVFLACLMDSFDLVWQVQCFSQSLTDLGAELGRVLSSSELWKEYWFVRFGVGYLYIIVILLYVVFFIEVIKNFFIDHFAFFFLTKLKENQWEKDEEPFVQQYMARLQKRIDRKEYMDMLRIFLIPGMLLGGVVIERVSTGVIPFLFA